MDLPKIMDAILFSISESVSFFMIQTLITGRRSSDGMLFFDSIIDRELGSRFKESLFVVFICDQVQIHTSSLHHMLFDTHTE